VRNPSSAGHWVQPFFKSKYPHFCHSILLSPDTNSHSCIHNSVTAPFQNKINQYHIPLHISFWSIPLLLSSHKMPYVSCTTEVFWPEFWIGTSTLIYVSQMSPISASLVLFSFIMAVKHNYVYYTWIQSVYLTTCFDQYLTIIRSMRAILCTFVSCSVYLYNVCTLIFSSALIMMFFM
jgi:hypothetical protein